jgi:hypothetical protein
MGRFSETLAEEIEDRSHAESILHRVNATVEAFAYVVEPPVETSAASSTSFSATNVVGVTGIRLNANPWHWMTKSMKEQAGKMTGTSINQSQLVTLAAQFQALLDENLSSTSARISYIKAVAATDGASPTSKEESTQWVKFISTSMVPPMAHLLAKSCLYGNGIYRCFFDDEDIFDVGPSFDINELQRALVPELDRLRAWQIAGIQMESYLDTAIVALSTTKHRDRVVMVGKVCHQVREALSRDAKRRAEHGDGIGTGNRLRFRSVISKQKIELILSQLGYCDPDDEVVDFGSGIGITRSDLVRLAEGEWLNDTLIDVEVGDKKSYQTFLLLYYSNIIIQS